MKPTSVKVGAHDYEIRYEPVLEGDAIGLCHRHERIIRIKDALTGTMLAETVLHEVMHAVYYCWNVYNSDEGNVSEEQAVNGLSCGLACVMRDNPEFVRFLQRNLK